MAKRSLWYKITKSQALRFLLSAGAGFLVDISVFYVFYHNLFTQNRYQVLSLSVRNSTLSLCVSYCLGVLVNFLITKYMVFNESKSSPAKQFIRFAAVAFVGYFANLGVLKIMIQSWGFYPPLARICAALSLFAASFFIHKFFSFSLSLRQHRQHEIKPDHQSGN
ncbi:GtrA family protein [Mucilaginibacter segetis]|uniref:GtrA family protein n=1 Tax=Mucilaginibacter segetis TaxID=2793071 RepID=A0A934UME7_9SPHI|nr:GtrA family protein [Mucilaginibacter segetis]MBK0379568.1 GtrA family protein [Mucilaginibacter segetis]